MWCGWALPGGVWQLHAPVRAQAPEHPCLPLCSCAARTVAGQNGTWKESGQACCLISALHNSPVFYCFAVTVVSRFFGTSKTQQVRFADPCLALYAAAGAKGEVVELRVSLGV